jgi:Icc-related predicted phosphoesterase
MRFALISDTHGFCPEIPTGVEAVIHAGDVAADVDVLQNYCNQIYPWAAAAGVPIHATFGNHDFAGEEGTLPGGCPANLRFYIDQAVDINGVKFWFSPWSNYIGPWAFMQDENGLAAKYAQIPDGTEVIVSHGPPKDYGDQITWKGHHVGSVALAKRCANLKKLRYVITGHIHEAFGEYDMNGVRVLNVSHVDENYQPTNQPVILEIASEQRNRKNTK